MSDYAEFLARKTAVAVAEIDAKRPENALSVDVRRFCVKRADFRRTKNDRPYVIPKGGDKEMLYTRVTTYAGCLSDNWALDNWSSRMTAIGLADDELLVQEIRSAEGDKDIIDGVVSRAQIAAGSKDAAQYGTDLHALTEWLDSGNVSRFDEIPERFKADAAAYLEVTAGMTHHAIEGKCVHDDLNVAGTFDRLSTVIDRRRILDLKTGSVDYAIGDIAVQLAIYANSDGYNPETHERYALDVDLETAMVIHVPAGTGTARLLEVDIAAGWEAAQLGKQVRAWRARKNLAREYVNPLAGMTPVDDALPDDIDTLRQMWTVSDDATRARIQAKVEEMSA